MVLALDALPVDVLRARLKRAARERMESTAPLPHARAGQVCVEVLTELRRRGVPLWRDPDAPCGCGCGAPGWAAPEPPAVVAPRTALSCR